MKPFTIAILLGFTAFLTTSFTHSKDYLKLCREKLAPAKGSRLTFAYMEKQHAFYHSPQPWQTWDSKSRGIISCDCEHLTQQDSVGENEKLRVSTLQFDTATLLSQPYWSKEPLDVDRATFDKQILELARYSPVLLVNALEKKHARADVESDGAHMVYSGKVHQTSVLLFIRKSDCLPSKVVARHHDDMLGDVTETIYYEQYVQTGKNHVPTSIRVEKMRGVTDTVTLIRPAVEKITMQAVVRPANYKIDEDAEKAPQIKTIKMGEHVYRINLPHAETQIGLIEFRDFMVVLGAPLSSANGELIIQEAKRLAPGKPIRYFAFGHHHAWYLGGVRPFIHKGTTVLTTGADLPYIRFVAEAPHAMKPDSLYLQPKPLLAETVDSMKRISDGQMELHLYHIGMKSGHTEDYMIFYIPSEKLVFVDDLLWVNKEGPVKKASKTQKGFYQAVKDLGLDVRTVVQGWPTGENRSNKNVIPFEDIEQSVKLE